MDIDFKESSSLINLVDFIQIKFPEYKIVEDKSDKSQTRLTNLAEDIDVYYKKASDEWLYFNRTSPMKNGIADRGNIIQFLRARIGVDNYKGIRDYLNSYVNSVSLETLKNESISRKKSREPGTPEFFKRGLSPVNEYEKELMKSRGIPSRLLDHPLLKNRIFNYTQTTSKGKVTNNLGFPLVTAEGVLTGLELKAKKTPKFPGKFTANRSSKDESFWHTNITKDSKHLIIGEDPFDALSRITMKGIRPDEVYMGTCGKFGFNKVEAINQFIISNNLEKVTLANDNDIAGRSYNLSQASYLFSQATKANPAFYIKANAFKNENFISIEARNISNEAIYEMIRYCPALQIISQNGSNYIEGKLNYDPRQIDKLLKEIVSFRNDIKSGQINFDYAISKDFNQDLMQIQTHEHKLDKNKNQSL